MAGGLARPLHRLRDALLDLLAHLEAGFDFADEELAFITPEELDRRLAEAEATSAAMLRQVASRGEAADAFEPCSVGRPNTGKSSLFNALGRRSRGAGLGPSRHDTRLSYRGTSSWTA